MQILDMSSFQKMNMRAREFEHLLLTDPGSTDITLLQAATCKARALESCLAQPTAPRRRRATISDPAHARPGPLRTLGNVWHVFVVLGKDACFQKPGCLQIDRMHVACIFGVIS